MTPHFLIWSFGPKIGSVDRICHQTDSMNRFYLDVKTSTLEGRHRRFTRGSAFDMSFRGLLSLLATQQKWYHHLQQVVQSLIPHYYRQNIGVPSNLHVAHTHTRTVTELFAYEVLLYSKQSVLMLFSSKFWYSTSHYRSSKQEARAPDTVNGSRRVC